MPRYHNAHFCVNCDEELSSFERMYSDGRCPYCGFKHPSSCTIVRTKEGFYYYERVAPWWKFWVRNKVRRVVLRSP